MLFKDIKQNYPVYILNKQDVSFSQGKVTSVSFPHLDNSNAMVMGKTVIDVAIEVDGKSATYAIPENLSIVYASDIVLSTDKEGIMREVEAMKSSAEQAIKNVERQKTIAERAGTLLTELNPIYREKQENEQRIAKMESSIGEMGKSIEELKKMFTGFLNEKKG